MKKNLSATILFSSLILAACNDSDPQEPATGDGDSTETTVYEFASRFQEASSVSYSGQIMRHVLISDLNSYIGTLNESIESSAAFDASTVEDALLSYYEFDSATLGDNDLLLTTDPASLQETYNDISSDKDLVSKIAGQDSGGEKDHKDWSSEFGGWKDASIAEFGGSIESPDGLIRAFLATLANNAKLQSDGDSSRDGLLTHQTPAGQDIQQLVQKFLLGAVAFSQGTDDYLDEGLDSDNSAAEEGEAFTALEHAWDEAFGYFGASRDYLDQSDQDIADGVTRDTNDDGKIDLTSEMNFGASQNAAKRDLGSSTGTDFTKEAMTAFLKGRSLIEAEADLADVQEQAVLASVTWEKALASTAIHYINDVLGDQETFGTDEYSFTDHAKHWSELKGFALGLQFNPRSPLSDEDFAEIHDLIGDQPVLESATEDEQSAYAEALEAARAILGDAYEFAAEDVNNW